MKKILIKIAAVLAIIVTMASTVGGQDYSKLTNHSNEAKELKQLSGSREWKDSSGKHAIRARFKRFDLATASVVLRKTNGDEISVQLARLGKDEIATSSRIIELRELLNDQLIEYLTLQNKELIAELDKRTAAGDAEKQKLVAEIQRLSVYAPSNSLAKDGIPEVTTARLEALGHNYVGKEVKMLGCTFSGVSSSYEDDFDQPVTGFMVYDSKGDLYQFMVAPRGEFAEFLVSLEEDQKLNISGTVVKFGSNGWYAIVATNIEKVPE